MTIDVNCPFPDCGIGFLLEETDEVYPEHTPGGRTELVDTAGLCPASGINFVGGILIIPEELGTEIAKDDDEGMEEFLQELLAAMSEPVKDADEPIYWTCGYKAPRPDEGEAR